MSDLEDRSLVTNAKQAHRMLALIEPYGGKYDPIDVPYAGNPIDARPINHPRFAFLMRSETAGEDPAPLRLVGMLEQHKGELDRRNRTGSGIWLELPGDAMLALDVRVSPLPSAAPAVPASVVVQSGRKHDGHQYETWLWLTSKPLEAKQRAEISEALSKLGNVHEGKKVLVRLAGYYNRIGLPSMVHAHGHLQDDGIRRGTRWDPEHLRRTFAGEMAAAD